MTQSLQTATHVIANRSPGDLTDTVAYAYLYCHPTALIISRYR